MYTIPKEPIRARRESDGAITPLRVNSLNELLVSLGSSPVNVSADNVSVDAATNALMVLDLWRQKINEGNAFLAFYDDAMAADTGNIRLLLTTPNTDKLIHLRYDVAVAGAATVKLCEAPTTSAAGDECIAVNRDRNSAVEAGLVVTSTPTVTLATSVIQDLHLLAGNTYVSPQEFILKKNTKYLLAISNTTASENQASVNLEWYEHENIV